ncbi:hypothetical protein [Parendozoicomonas sp. Alg238-R29]|uniref:alpha/beta hydrolase n=1 Tax=Parendozoicomonas sp. Alg238-R29 TaxID=2993446 RepID=UPI00248E64D7|nr:hypothetical protein [Parendozoicomonas sp. Alg238-R29]
MNTAPLQFLENRSQEGSKTCVILFHGYGASMADLYGISDYLDPEKSCDWFFPDGWLTAEGGGRAWFPIDMAEFQMAMMTGTPRNLKDKNSEEFQKSIELGKQFIERLLPEYDNAIVGGFSQGAMIGSHIAPQLSDRIKGLWLFSGNLIAETALDSLLNTSRPLALLQSHGRQDPVLGFEYGHSLYKKLLDNGYSGEFVAFDGQHEIPPVVLEKAKAALELCK